MKHPNNITDAIRLIQHYAVKPPVSPFMRFIDYAATIIFATAYFYTLIHLIKWLVKVM